MNRSGLAQPLAAATRRPARAGRPGGLRRHLGDSGGDGGGGGKLTLVAYSTPRRRTRRSSRPSQDAGGQGRQFDQSYARLGRPEPRRRGRPAGRHRRALARAGHHAPRRRRPGRRGLEPGRVQGHRHRLGRGLRRPQGQPEGHQDLGRPDQGRRRGHHPEPVHLGRRAVEHHGRLRRPARAGQDRGGGARVPAAAVRERAGAGQERARGARRRSPAARATCCSPTRTRRSPPSRRARTSTTSIPDQTILIENPVAVVTESEQPGEGAGVPRLPAHARRRRRSSGSKGYRPVPGGRWRRVRRSPTPPELFTIDEARRLGRGQRRVLRPGERASSPRSSSSQGSHRLRLARQPPAAPPARRRPERGRPSGRRRSASASSTPT